MAACNSIAVNSVVNFLPIILAGMGYSPVMCQILAAPPQIFSCIVGFLCATIADRTRKRGPIIVFGVIMCIIGLVLSAYSNSNWVRYLGAIFGAAGCNSNIPAIFSYQSNNIRTSSERAVGTALVVGSAAAGGIVASIVFRHEDAPRYVHGFLVALASQAVLFGAVMTLTFLFRAANEKHRRDELKKPLEGHPDFTYTY
jgi:MFS family permease